MATPGEHSPGRDSVEIVEVGPRDGLQNESVIVSTADKRRFVELLISSGLRRIEVTSFVHPLRVPQMADAEELLASFGDRRSIEFSALVLNGRGIERAIAAGVCGVNIVVVATDEFSRRNQGVTTDEGVRRFCKMAERVREAGLRVTLTVGASFGCPFEGEVDPARVAMIVQQCLKGPVDEICLADTIGVATPGRVGSLFRVIAGITDTPLRAHFHNTRNAGYANAFAALGAGVRSLDASTGGIGGCPFAPAATGNIATEDLLWSLQRDGSAFEVDLSRVQAAATFIGRVLDRKLPAMLGKCPAFP